jgi:hypothetical protein
VIETLDSLSVAASKVKVPAIVPWTMKGGR